jgi:hypothetical protein
MNWEGNGRNPDICLQGLSKIGEHPCKEMGVPAENRIQPSLLGQPGRTEEFTTTCWQWSDNSGHSDDKEMYFSLNRLF